VLGLAGLLLGGVPGAGAEEEPKPPAGGVDEGEDLGDKNVPFHQQVNQAIDRGVNWLLARPMRGQIPGTEGMKGAHWGLVKGEKIYGGGEGTQYRHPAGPTALALYTLLKCGVEPDHPLIEEGFAWLRSVHQVTEAWDGNDASGRDRWWTHTVAGSSYEISVMLLALTARYDQYKKSSASDEAAKKGRLKIKNLADRHWLQQLVTALVERRGQPSAAAIAVDRLTIEKFSDFEKEMERPADLPTDLPSREQRLGWRYNPPHVDLYVGMRGGGRDSWQRNVRIPPHANQDMSSTQLATIALYSATRFGVNIDPQVWIDIVDFTLAHQEKEGPEHERHDPGYSDGRYAKAKDHARGFCYIVGSPDGSEGIATGSMTACGIGNLLLAKSALFADTKDKRYAKAREEWTAKGWPKTVDTAVWDGLAWLDRNWSPFTNTRSRYGYHIYYLYCVERTMDILRKQLIGKRLWYPEGAKEILARQKPKEVEVPGKQGAKTLPGVWWETGATHEPKDVLDTCFALLYLKRATGGLVPGGVPVTGTESGPADGR